MIHKPAIVLPEQGQIVTVRQRRFIVAEVNQSTLPASALLEPAILPSHLVTLNAIDDDSLGESVQLIWELEVAPRIEDKSGLPAMTGFDPPGQLDAFLDAVRWGAASSADLKSLQAPFRSGIEIEDYQLDPLVRAIQMPRANLLIADDVGLGKTIEAGLVVQELIVRNRVRTALIVCPAALQMQWRDQMRDKFGLEFRIVDSNLMRSLRRSRGLHVNPWTHFPRLITSIDFLKRDRPMRLYREALPSEDEPKYPRRFDLLIVDEAHNVAPVGRGKYATDSLRTLAVRTLAPHFEHKLFLSATPHNGYKESFTSLLELLDSQRFARGIEPDREQLQAVMVRRLKSELKDWSGAQRFPSRKLEALPVDYSDGEKQVHTWLNEYTALRQAHAHDAQERFATEFVLKLLKKRLFSSPAAFAITLEKHWQSVTRTASENISQKAARHRPSLGVLQHYLDQAEEDYADDTAYESAAEDAVETASQILPLLSQQERELLQHMREWAKEATLRGDRKTETLINWLRDVVKPNGVWSDERVIIFTEYRATQDWLFNRFAAAGLTENERTLRIYGGIDLEERERVKAAFQAAPSLNPVRILLATDAASEGIDLQNYCHRVVHIEIPWNPNRLEQRNGRVDRHGQRHDVQIYHFVSKDYRSQVEAGARPGTLEADLEFLMRAAEKVEQIREDLGKVGPVIAEQVEEAMMGHRSRLNTAAAERESEPVRRMLKFERELGKLIARHVEQLQETKRDLRLSPEHIQRAVATALRIAGQPALKPVTLPDGLHAFALPALSGSWAYCAEGLPHPLTRAVRPIVFDHELARGRDDVVLAHLNHRLVQMALRLLRAEVWSPASVRGLHRITARVVSNTALNAPAAIVHARLVVIGGESDRLHEEIIAAGGLIHDGRLQRMGQNDLNAALDAAEDANEQPSDAMLTRLRQLWPQLVGPAMSALDVRMRARVESVQKLLTERATQEAENISAVLMELHRAIERELKEPELLQLELFNSEERNQVERNRDALQLRLTQIPQEIEAERKAVAARYADPQPRLFPVAITFLVPKRLA